MQGIGVTSARWTGLVGTFLLVYASAYGQRPQDIEYEPLTYEFHATSSPTASALGLAPGEELLSFDAFGRRFEILLRSNSRLIGSLTVEQRRAISNIRLFTGEVIGSPRSWVRVTRSESYLSGVIFDGTDYFGIDELARLVSAGTASDGTDVVIYPITDTAQNLIDDIVIPAPDRSAPRLEKQTLYDQIVYAPKLDTGKSIEVGLIADAEFHAANGDDTEAAILSILNVADGNFIEQIGIQLKLASLVVYEAEPDPFQAQDGPGLLVQLEDLKVSDPQLTQLGLVHLFTARNLEEGPNSGGQLAGIANLAAICMQRYGTALTQATYSPAVNAFITMHEFGHNFGAPHDGVAGSACADVPDGFVMMPFPSSDRFSECSIDQMLPVISGASCLRNLDPVDLTLEVIDEPPAYVGQGQSFDVRVELRNEGAIDAVGPKLIVAAPSLRGPVLVNESPNFWEVLADSGGCDAGAEPAYCLFPYFRAQSAIQTGLRFFADSPGTAEIELSLISLSDADPDEDVTALRIEVLPLVDLRSTIGVETILLSPGQTATVTVTVENLGEAAASEVQVRLWLLSTEVEFVAVSLPDCEWEGDAYSGGYECPVGALAAREAQSIDIRLRAAETIVENSSAGLNVAVSSREPEARQGDNWAATTIKLGEAFADIALVLSGDTRLRVDEPFELTLTVTNNGPDTAYGITLFHDPIGTPLATELTSIATTHGDCLLDAEANAIDCHIASLGSGESATITLAGTPSTPGAHALQMRVSSASADQDSTNDYSALFASVSNAPPDAPATSNDDGGTGASTSNTGGGGGAMDILTLILLLLVLGSKAQSIRACITATSKSSRNCCRSA